MKTKFKVIFILVSAILVLGLIPLIQDHAGSEGSTIAVAEAVYGEDKTPPAVDTGLITTSSGTHHSINLSWEPARDTVTEAVDLQYKVICSAEDNISTVADAVYNGTTVHNWTENLTSTEITDLHPDTAYYFNIIVQDEAKNKSIYEMKEQKTLKGPRSIFGGENGTELFLGGNYIELGISNWGDFGTLGEKPANFRGTRGGEKYGGDTDSIGMSADHDGFNNGRDLPIDYYLPGTKEERFVVGYQIGEETFDNTNSAQMSDKNMFTTIIDHSSIEEDLLKAEVISTWDGKMEITQIISFKTNDKFYRNEVILKNISDKTWDGARYMRSFDPDNTKFRGGAYETSNMVTHTVEEDNKAVVKAETYDDNDLLYKAFGTRAPIFFYSNNPAAVASVFGFTNKNPYEPAAYETPFPKGEEKRDDVAITITWDSGALAPEESKTFVYYTSLDERDFDDMQGEIIVADIKKDIEDIGDMEDVKEVKDKIDKEKQLEEEKKKELKSEVIDEVLGFPPVKDISVNDDDDIRVMRKLIKESDKEEDEKDDLRLNLVDKSIEDIGKENITGEDKTALDEVVEDIIDKDKKAEAESKLEGIDGSNDKSEIESGGSSSRSKDSSRKETGVIVIVNGKQQKAGVETVIEKNGEKTVEIRTDSSVLHKKIDEVLKESEKAGNSVSKLVEIPVLSKDSSLIKSILTGDLIKKMEENDFTLSINTEKWDYIIPAKAIGIEQVASTLGVKPESLEKIEIQVEIEKLDEKQVKEIEEKGKSQGYEILVSPVAFKVTAKTTTDSGVVREVTVSKFSNYVSRVMKIPSGIDSNKITTGIYFNKDGTFSHIPTEVFNKEEQWYAQLNSLTNSSYSVIWNPAEVKAVENHWSKETVNDMASRLIIKNPEEFKPDGNINRGEFAEYITKALGVYRTGIAKEEKFTDINITNDLADAIDVATTYGIINGYPDGSFKPYNQISREEAMVMYARAMDIVGLKSVDKNRIENYTDKQEVADWAYDAVRKTVGAGVFNGKTIDTIDPKGTFTYAEAATAIRNLLTASGLINK